MNDNILETMSAREYCKAIKAIENETTNNIKGMLNTLKSNKSLEEIISHCKEIVFEKFIVQFEEMEQQNARLFGYPDEVRETMQLVMMNYLDDAINKGTLNQNQYILLQHRMIESNRQ
jgi:retron-type reverse transcriptase